MMVLIIGLVVLAFIFALIVVVELSYSKDKKEIDLAYQKELEFRESKHYPLEINKGK
jgi:hypothetical protein